MAIHLFIAQLSFCECHEHLERLVHFLDHKDSSRSVDLCQLQRTRARKRCVFSHSQPTLAHSSISFFSRSTSNSIFLASDALQDLFSFTSFFLTTFKLLVVLFSTKLIQFPLSFAFVLHGITQTQINDCN